jgi:hypothetical protein
MGRNILLDHGARTTIKHFGVEKVTETIAFWMLWWLCLVSFPDGTVHNLDIHGEVQVLHPDQNASAVYFGAGFGDFGHTVNVRAWKKGIEAPIDYSENHGANGTWTDRAKTQGIFMDGGTSQYRVFRVNTTGDEEVVVSVASTVRPIHPNRATMVLFSFFVFFGVNFIVTGVLQFLYFKGAMDPNEYRIADTD